MAVEFAFRQTSQYYICFFTSLQKHGVTKAEITAIITHAAMYTGLPKGWEAFRLAKDVWNEAVPEVNAKAQYQNTIFFPIGEPNTAYAQYFTGNSYLAEVAAAPLPVHNVTFEPGCRNNWHIHHAASGGGQLLICIGGRGWYQEAGKQAVPMTPGTVITIPANVKHWHGAASDSWFSHLAISIPGEGASSEWCEPVSDAEYGTLAE